MTENCFIFTRNNKIEDNKTNIFKILKEKKFENYIQQKKVLKAK